MPCAYLKWSFVVLGVVVIDKTAEAVTTSETAEAVTTSGYRWGWWWWGAWVGVALFTAVSRLWGMGRVPPGLWFDEAWVTVQALGSDTPLYFAANFGGMHPAIVYLTRFFQPLLAYDPLTIRYAVVLVSITAVLGSGVAYRAMWGAEWPPFSPRSRALYPLLAAFILSILYPFFHFSRLGFESILPAPLALLAFGLLAGYLHDERRRWGWLVGLGMACGLGLYLFDTARFVPLGIAGAFWWAWLVEGSGERERFVPTAVRFGVVVSTAVLFASPLLLYFAQNWTQLTERAAVTTYNTLGPGAESVPWAVAQNVGRTVGGLFLPGWGDGIARHNLPGRAIFDPFLGILFLLGLGLLLRRPRWLLSALFLPWLLLTLLPVVLTDGAPTYTRLFGAVPALAGITAVGGVWLWARGRWGMLFLLVGLVFSTAVTLTDYFIRWPQTPQLYDDFQVGQWEAGQLALARAQAGEQVYFVPDQLNLDNPTLALLLADTAVWPHPPSPCLLLPPDPHRPTTYLIDERADKQMTAQLTHLGHFTETGRIQHQPTGDTIYRALTLPTDKSPTLLPHLTPVSAQFGAGLSLHSQQISQDEAGIQLTLLWEATAPLPEPYTLFLHLYPVGAENAAPVAQLDVAPCWPTDQWRVGEQVLDQLMLAWPNGLPEGEYTLALGWYAYPSLARLPLVSTSALPDNRLWLGEVRYE